DWRHDDGATARSVGEKRHPTREGDDGRAHAAEVARRLEETRVRRPANRGPRALRSGKDGPGILDRASRDRGRSGDCEGAGGLALERGYGARLRLRRMPQLAAGTD